MRQVPLGPDNLVCPLHRETMDKVCHKCPWWKKIVGQTAQGEQVDQYDCAVAWLPALTLEVAKEARQGGAATESFRNEMVKRADAPREITYNVSQ